MIVNESAARQFFVPPPPGQNSSAWAPDWRLQVIGVVRMPSTNASMSRRHSRLSLAMGQYPHSYPSLKFRTADTLSFQCASPPAVRQRLADVSAESRSSFAASRRRWTNPRAAAPGSGALALFGALALALSMVGLYGVTHIPSPGGKAEIGVRVALGARHESGSLADPAGCRRSAGHRDRPGAVGALDSARLLSSLLYGVEPNDPVLMFGGGAMLAAGDPRWQPLFQHGVGSGWTP